MTHDILKKIMDKLDRLANEYLETKDITKLTEFIQFRDDALKWITEMSFGGIVDFDTGWNSDIYISYVTHKVGCFGPHEEVCNCILCHEEQVKEFIDWRLAL